MEFTLFELHFPDAEFNAPYANQTGGSGAEGAVETAVPADEGSSSRMMPIAAVLGLVGVALLARYLRGGETDQATLDEVEA